MSPPIQAHHVWGIYSLQTAVSAVCPCGAEAFTWSQKLSLVIYCPCFYPTKGQAMFLWQSPSSTRRFRTGFNLVFPDPTVFAKGSRYLDISPSISPDLSISGSLSIDLSIALYLIFLSIYASGWWIFSSNPDPHWDAPIWGSIFPNWVLQPSIHILSIW